MSWNDISKILDLEGSLEARCKEASKGSDDRGKEGHPEGVEEEGVDGQGLLVDQETRPGAQGLEGQPPLLEMRVIRKDFNFQKLTCCRNRREGSHDMVICSNSVEYSIGQTKYGA